MDGRAKMSGWLPLRAADSMEKAVMESGEVPGSAAGGTKVKSPARNREFSSCSVWI